jgi:hypothetical protein
MHSPCSYARAEPAWTWDDGRTRCIFEGGEYPLVSGRDARFMESTLLQCPFCGADNPLNTSTCSVCGKGPITERVPLPPLVPKPGTEDYVPPWLREVVPASADAQAQLNAPELALSPQLPPGEFFGEDGLPPALLRVKADMEADRRSRTGGDSGYVPPWLRQDAEEELPPIPGPEQPGATGEAAPVQPGSARGQALESTAGARAQTVPAREPAWMRAESQDETVPLPQDETVPRPIAAVPSERVGRASIPKRETSGTLLRVGLVVGVLVVLTGVYFASKEYGWAPEKKPAVGLPMLPTPPAMVPAETAPTPAAEKDNGAAPSGTLNEGAGKGRAVPAPSPPSKALPSPALAAPAPAPQLDKRSAKLPAPQQAVPAKRPVPKRPVVAEPEPEAEIQSPPRPWNIPEAQAPQPRAPLPPVDQGLPEIDVPKPAPRLPARPPAPAGEPDRDSLIAARIWA